ncbi:DNA-methyltransferase [Klenkia brasiliensis]|uniref:DNA methylase n=1 Tax=Klenkia brasiliensis TaxID=333142 RepID=A0A1G7YHK7_9ACTN|nr:site-specific DNA-methyltransferase [Klenkia brasiliensis]SDG95993.1 DNA methylase [Klenkia brasiliensis]
MTGVEQDLPRVESVPGQLTAPHYADDQVTVLHGDCLELLAELPDASIDAVVTDPPYGIGFMGHQWDQPGRYGALRAAGRPDVHRRRPDGDLEKISEGAMEAGRYDVSRSANALFQEWCHAWASECFRVLKPGGHFVSFGGSRTWHRLAAAVEDAGFEVRDSIAWLYGQGFPKSLDVSKAIDRAAGAERPRQAAQRRVRPSDSIHASGFGADGWAPQTRDAQTEDAERWQGWGTALKPAFEPIVVGRKPLAGSVAANVLTHGTGALNVDGCRVPMSPGDAAAIDAKHAGMDPDDYERARGAALNLSAGDSRLALQPAAAHELGRWPTNVLLQAETAAQLDTETGTRPAGAHPAKRAGIGYGGSQTGTAGERTELPPGGASRYFPTFHWEAKAPPSERPRDGETAHPTVKPLDLMRWLVRLVTPPGGLVLDPFAGSGTTAEACVVEGFRCTTIEREAKYLPLIVGRLAKPIQGVLL